MRWLLGLILMLALPRCGGEKELDGETASDPRHPELGHCAVAQPLMGETGERSEQRRTKPRRGD